MKKIVGLGFIVLLLSITEGCMTIHEINAPPPAPYLSRYGCTDPVFGILSEIIGDELIGYAITYNKNKTHDDNVRKGISTGALIFLVDLTVSTLISSNRTYPDRPFSTPKINYGEVTDLTKFVPSGILKVEQSFKNYTVRIYKDNETGGQTFEILKDGKIVYAHKGFYFEIGTISEKCGQNTLIAMGKDITGEGNPNLVVTEQTEMINYRYGSYVFEIGKTFRKIATINGQFSIPRFDDLDKDGKLEIIIQDWPTTYSLRSFDESPESTIILHFRDGAYHFAGDLMRKPPLTMGKLKELAEKQIEVWKREDLIPSQQISYLVRPMMELIYSGNADQAWQFFDMAWPNDVRIDLKKKELLKDFKKQLSDSQYWHEIEELNNRKIVPPK